MLESEIKLVNDNHNLIYSFLAANKLDYEDWYTYAAIGICRAATRYRGDVSAFSTFAYKCMYTEIRNEKSVRFLLWSTGRLPSEYNHMSSLDASERYDIVSDCNVEEQAIYQVMCEEFCNKQTNKDAYAMCLVGKQQIDIALECGISQSHVSRIKKECEIFVDTLRKE